MGFIDVSGQDLAAQLVDDLFLDQAFKWPCSKLNVITIIGEVIYGIWGEVQHNTIFCD